MKSAKLITSDTELYNMLALWLGDEGIELTDSDSADLLILDTESTAETNGTAFSVLTIGDDDAELPRPFSRLTFTDAIHSKLGKQQLRFRVDVPRKRVYHNRNYAALTDKEYAVFRLLYDNINTPVSRDAISAVARGGEQETNAADVYICHLRRKLTELFGKNPIKTVRGVGYRLTISL